MKTPEEKYRQGHDHIFGGGPKPRPDLDGIEVTIGGEVVDPSILDLPSEYSSGPVLPPISLQYVCGSMRFAGTELRCGLVVAPAHDDDSTGMVVHLAGNKVDVMHMVLAAIDAARGFGLGDVLKHCIEQDIGLGDVRKVLGEEWYEG